MKYRNTILIIALGIILIWSSGCHKPHGINGNNQVTTETRQVFSFNNITNEGSFNVYITHDSIYQVIVEAESNLIPHIRTLVNGNTLVIDTRENLNSNGPINIYVKTPELYGVKLSGSGLMSIDSLGTDHMNVEISGSGNINGKIVANNTVNAKISGSGNIFLELQTTNIDTKISGSGNIDLTGETNTGTHTISGSGNINSYNFVQKSCTARISGSGNMYLNVIDNLDINISGSGSIFYIGNPQTNIKITGSGSVHKQ